MKDKIVPKSLFDIFVSLFSIYFVVFYNSLVIKKVFINPEMVFYGMFPLLMSSYYKFIHFISKEKKSNEYIMMATAIIICIVIFFAIESHCRGVDDILYKITYYTVFSIPPLYLAFYVCYVCNLREG